MDIFNLLTIYWKNHINLRLLVNNNDLVLMQNIFHKFVKSRDMWKFHNALLRYKDKEFYVDLDLESHSDRPKSKNHVTIKSRWKYIVAKCGWEKDKMVRFKLVEEIPDVKASVHSRKPVMIPVFHMC